MGNSVCCSAGGSSDEIVVMRPDSAEVIEPGLVLLHGAASPHMQLKLAASAKSWGERAGEGGFYATDATTGARTFNAAQSRGRIYDHISRFPQWVHDLCGDSVAHARAADAGMPGMACTHLLLNYYASPEGLQWHRDIYENDGTGDHPIVNVSVGSACRFQFKHFTEDPVREVTLKSGDILLFGGPCRYIMHTVEEVLLDELPESWPYGPGRFSFTFRDAPEVVGREEEFKYFKPSENLISQEDWEERYRTGETPPRIGAQASQSSKSRAGEPLPASPHPAAAGA